MRLLSLRVGRVDRCCHGEPAAVERRSLQVFHLTFRNSSRYSSINQEDMHSSTRWRFRLVRALLSLVVGGTALAAAYGLAPVFWHEASTDYCGYGFSIKYPRTWSATTTDNGLEIRSSNKKSVVHFDCHPSDNFSVNHRNTPVPSPDPMNWTVWSSLVYSRMTQTIKTF